MKKVETYYGKVDGRNYKIIPIFEIEKAIIEAQTLISSRYKEAPTIKQIVEDRNKMAMKVENDVGITIPFYNIYALIRNSSYEKKIKVYDNLLEMYSYAYNCPFDFLEYEELTDTYNLNYDIEQTGHKIMNLKEILKTRVDVSKLSGDFAKEFATYKFNTMNNIGFGRKYVKSEEFLAIEKKVLDGYIKEEKPQQDKPVNRKR